MHRILPVAADGARQGDAAGIFDGKIYGKIDLEAVLL